MAYTSVSFTYNEVPGAAKWNYLGSNDAYFDSLIGSGTAWASWTPTWTNLTVGNGVEAGYQLTLGKIVFFRYYLTFGTTSSMGTDPTFTLPATSVSYGGTAGTQVIGDARYSDFGVTSYPAVVVWQSTTTAKLQHFGVTTHVGNVSLLNFQTTASIPFSFATNDIVHFQGFIEKA